ncbi:hypothetical protein [Clostridium transplantifaecale]
MQMAGMKFQTRSGAVFGKQVNILDHRRKTGTF